MRIEQIWIKSEFMKTFEWNGSEGPVGKSFDLFGDGSVVMVNIPGHSEGLCALKIKNEEGKTVILFATSGGSSIKKACEDMKAAYPDVNWKEGKLLNRASKKDLEDWVKK